MFRKKIIVLQVFYLEVNDAHLPNYFLRNFHVLRRFVWHDK